MTDREYRPTRTATPSEANHTLGSRPGPRTLMSYDEGVYSLILLFCLPRIVLLLSLTFIVVKGKTTTQGAERKGSAAWQTESTPTRTATPSGKTLLFGSRSDQDQKSYTKWGGSTPLGVVPVRALSCLSTGEYIHYSPLPPTLHRHPPPLAHLHRRQR